MAITYKFSCPACDAKGEIYVGTTRADCKAGKPDYELAVCYDCKKLMHTTNRCCGYCGTKEYQMNNMDDDGYFSLYDKIRKAFKKNKATKQLVIPDDYGFRIIDTSSPTSVKNITCPKCFHNYLNATPVIFHD